MAEVAAAIVPRATYRLQFRDSFGFAEAAGLAPYLARLGISHVYASPYLAARPGSAHGYDIIDHARLNPAIGDADAFREMVATFRRHGLGQVLDIVPNHMGVGGADNPWWLDVLEWGRKSDYAGWFDIDWAPDRRYLDGQLLVPLLGDHYGVVLESGELVLRFDAGAGSFAVWAYGTHKLPVCPLHYGRILGDEHPELETVGDAFSGLADWRPHAARRARDLQAALAALAARCPDVGQAIDAAVIRINGRPGDLASWRGLDALIAGQHWRAAHFRVAADDINYRRFFNINELAGIRMELPELFDHAHRFIFELVGDGSLDGLRIDHVDGLLDPKAYLQRLRALAPRPFYLVVEKILARHESLREDWPVDGTTGYEFANLILGLLLDPAGEAGISQTYADFAQDRRPFGEIVRDCKIRIMKSEMASELNVLARDAARIARQNPRTADFTRNILQRGLREIIACFPVYRTYVDTDGAADSDRRDIDWAVAQARRNEADVDPGVFDFLQRLLTTELVAAPRSGYSRHRVARFAMRVQQYSGPVMAKGLEDTALYRYNRFAALNEVGGSPDNFGLPLPAFHKANVQRRERWPNAMLGTSTHDTKHGEDVRARLAVLAELPEEWARQVQAWSRLLRARRGDVEGTAPPDRRDEYLFYQLMLGAWPAELTGEATPDPEAIAGFAARLQDAMIKSVREARLQSSWVSPNAAYEQALSSFVGDGLDLSKPGGFLGLFLPFQERVARLGVRNSLVQVALKLTLPGMPDLYQGTELWDLSLMDPDNRRTVDYGLRARQLDRVAAALHGDRRAAMTSMLADWRDGRIKLALTAALLAFRRERPALLAAGSYEPLSATGSKANHLCAFARRHDEAILVVVAARFPARLEADPGWNGTAIEWPHAAPVSQWRDLLTGRILPGGGMPDASLLLADLPVAALVSETG